jgi:AbrB family looped-hinge helix DNA binding protein
VKSAIDAAGRVVIPKPIRQVAGLKAGTALEIAYRDGKIEIEPKTSKIRLVRKGSVLIASVPGRKLSLKEVNEWVRKSREREI